MTYSIVAMDRETGELGVAVQSHYFQVGPVVPWAVAGFGAVATQSMVNISFGPLGLDYLKAGYTAEQALKALLAGDTEPQSRQVAIVDAALAERMMIALEAAEAEGGDIRGKQSAAMLVVTGKPTGRTWEDRIIELRVEDAAEPLPELRRLLRVKRAYMALNESDKAADAGDQATAATKLREALKLAPEMVEISFWGGLGMAQNGQVDAGCELMQTAVRKDRRWIETLHRLVASDRLASDLASQIEARLTAGVGHQ
jgi:uncharacterized Ntn-hydrolase superfamily protein